MSGPARPWLAPLVPFYRLGQALSQARKPVRRLVWPVVSIGNLSTGGAGKTPLTIALAKALTSRGLRVDVLSRGYGRAASGTELVQKEGGAERFGDEPLLIARQAGVPVYVGRKRYEAGLLAESEQKPNAPAVHLLDDGFQHRQLHRDVDILLVNSHDLTDALLPAGNLREPLQALQRATVIAIPADEPEVEQYLREIISIGRNSETSRWTGPIWRLHRRMQVPPVAGPAVAFCGIARPEQFFTGIEAARVKLVARIPFPDHHRYTPKDLDQLRAVLRSTGASSLLTTEKDAVRLGALAAKLRFKTVPLRTEIENESAAMKWLVERLSSSSPKPSL